ncbi:stalk domain-containing protein [Paenibacillus chungangensis]|uniref:Stalk domain-containing protein n=1 Tax=Paenibacillus chungangensis TaxID=696535 RepID=A0ABW3HK58_9BACL
MRMEADSKKKHHHKVGRAIGRKVLVVVISGSMLAGPIAGLLPERMQQSMIESVYASSAPVLKLQSESMMTSGAKRLDYMWHTTRKGQSVKTAVHVIEVDLSNPHISLNAMSGVNNSTGQKNHLMNMTKDNGAVGGINGDVFVMTNEGAPLGAQVTSGTLISSPSSLKGMYAFAVTKEREPMVDAFAFTGSVTAENGGIFPLEGLNQSSYFSEREGETYSHVNKMFIYTSAWGGAERPANSATKPTEVLVRDGMIEQITSEAPIIDPIPENGYILRAHGEAAKFVLTNLAIGQPLQAEYTLKSQSTGQVIDPASLDMLIGGHTLLVDKGAPSIFTRDIAGVSGTSYTSRSAVGYSKDGKKVYLITSERADGHTGLSLKELQQVMVQLGVYKGLNLDGGGSTTMTERPLGQSGIKLAHSTQQGSQRYIANGIGVFTSAPAGELKGLVVGGPNVMFKGQSAQYSVNGYDTYYNPYQVDKSSLEWGVSGKAGSMENGAFTATATGKAVITVKSGDVKTEYDIHVIGKEDIASIKVNASAGMLIPGSKLSVPVTVKLKNGKAYKLSGDSLEWEFVGFEGSYSDGAVTVDSVNKDAKVGYAIARYDGVSAMVPWVKGEKVTVVEDFEVSRYAITSQVTPKETTKGGVKLVSDLPGQKKGRALQIAYDFSEGTGTKASYAVFGSDGRTISGSTSTMSMDVYSDNSNNWLRAEIIGADGAVHLVDIAKELNWDGWKEMHVNLSTEKIAYPAKLKRVYVVTIDQNSDKRKPVGAVAIDNIELRTSASVTEPPRAQITMTVGQTKALVDGKAIKLEASPILLNGSSYVPVRFVTEAMGAEVLYEHETRRVTVLRGNQMLEMNIGKKGYMLDGVSYPSEVAPFTRNGRTLIPVRLFSEKLGFDVDYDDEKRMIIIQ